MGVHGAPVWACGAHRVLGELDGHQECLSELQGKVATFVDGLRVHMYYSILGNSGEVVD